VLRTEDGAVSLLVDKIGDVIEVEQSSFEAAPETMLGSVRAMVLGVHKLDGRLLHLLDTGKACELAEAGTGRADESIS
jgi:purine-binding chemotaxis protein CheW